MASTVCASIDTDVPVYNRVRSLSHASHPIWPGDFPIPSPLVPGTPTNTPEIASPRSPSIVSPPANSPEAKSPLESGAASPAADKGATFHAPDFLKVHHFYSPLLSPIAPPNSPENWHLSGETMAIVEEDQSSKLGERMAALSHARPAKEGPTITIDEVKILKPETPKAPKNDYYEIRQVPGKGYGCFATRVIERGTRILADDPLLIVPVPDYFETDIKEAFAKLSPDEQALYFTLHSAHGQDPANWPKAIHPAVVGRERSRIEEQHRARTAKDPSLISIFQTNCMEKENAAAVFPHASRFNHSCNPNACFTWNPAIKKETIHTMRDIEKDEQITLSYCDMTHEKATRKWELKHYGFICDCPACAGDDSDPNSFAAKSAQRRYRLMELDEDFRRTRGAYIEMGAREKGFVAKLLEYAKLLIEEGDNTIRLANTFLDIALICERYKDWEMAKRSALKALKVKIECQGPEYPDVVRYRGVVQRIRKKMAAAAALGAP